jgi:uncharacterized membrane protein YbhN (UPF0104 family)
MPAMARRLSFWLSLTLPVLLLALILANVDLAAVARSLRGARLPLAAGALALAYLVPTLLLAWRWRWILRRFYGVERGYGFLLAEYWVTLFLGFWVPANLGSDVYRVIRVGKKAGGVPVNAATIVGEKFWALLVYGVLVLATYPLVAGSLDARPGVRLAVIRIGTLAAIGVVGLLVALTLRDSLARRLRGALRGSVMNRLGAAAQALLQRAAGDGEQSSFSTLLSPFFRWRNQAAGLALMVIVQLITSVGGLLLLRALGVSLPLAVNVFVWALMNFFFLIPASVAGFGVREAAFIVLLGLFGVSRESALAASFLALACNLAAIAPGGLIWLAGLHAPRAR